MRRPFAAVLTRAPRRLLWVAEVSTRGEDDLPVWTTLVGMDVVASGAARSDIRSMVRDVGDCADRMNVGLQRPIVEAIGALRESVSLSTVRERAICAGIRMRHARIAAELLQPGLFDRRAERRAAAQSSVFEEALAQCQSRIDDFARLAEPQAGPPVIRFAALL
jgi:hypothetical protein